MTPADVLRRNWRLAGAIGCFLMFTVIHFAFYRPAAARYRSAISSVGGIEAVFNPGAGRALIPPRVFALMTDNTLDPQVAQERGSSGELGVVLLEDLGRVASRTGLDVVSSEPQSVAQDALTTQIRAHLVLQGSYDGIATFFGALSQSQTLMIVEHFSLTQGPAGRDLLDLTVARLYLKQAGTQR